MSCLWYPSIQFMIIDFIFYYLKNWSPKVIPCHSSPDNFIASEHFSNKAHDNS